MDRKIEISIIEFCNKIYGAIMLTCSLIFILGPFVIGALTDAETGIVSFGVLLFGLIFLVAVYSFVLDHFERKGDPETNRMEKLLEKAGEVIIQTFENEADSWRQPKQYRAVLKTGGWSSESGLWSNRDKAIRALFNDIRDRVWEECYRLQHGSPY